MCVSVSVHACVHVEYIWGNVYVCSAYTCVCSVCVHVQMSMLYGMPLCVQECIWMPFHSFQLHSSGTKSMNATSSPCTAEPQCRDTYLFSHILLQPQARECLPLAAQFLQRCKYEVNGRHHTGASWDSLTGTEEFQVRLCVFIVLIRAIFIPNSTAHYRRGFFY